MPAKKKTVNPAKAALKTQIKQLRASIQRMKADLATMVTVRRKSIQQASDRLSNLRSRLSNIK